MTAEDTNYLRLMVEWREQPSSTPTAAQTGERP